MNTNTVKIFLSSLFLTILSLFLSLLCYSETDNNVLAADKQSKQSGLIYVADIVSVQGNGLLIKRSNCPNPIAGRVNMADYLKDILTTDKNTMACIEFLNGSQIALGKDTSIEIITSSSVAESGQASGVQKMSVKNGSVWGKMEGKNNNLKVETGNGVMGVKGTEFVIEKNSQTGEETITLLEGEVDFTSATGEKMMLKPGEEVYFKKGRKALKRLGDAKKIRALLNNRHKNLNPGTQRMLTVLSAQYRHLKSRNPERAKIMAARLRNFMDNPEKYVKKIRDQRSKDPGTDSRYNKPSRQLRPGTYNKPETTERPLSKPRQERPVKPETVDKQSKQDKTEETDKPHQTEKTEKPHRRLIERNVSAEQSDRVKGLSPCDALVDTYYPVLSWDKVEGASSYQVIVARNPFKKGQDDPLFQMFAQTDKTQLEYPSYARSLKPGQIYFWMVIPLSDDENLAGLPSKPAKFRMAGYRRLGIKGLYPTGDIPSGENRICFNWTPVSVAENYKFEVSDNPEMNNPVLSYESIEPFYTPDDTSGILKEDTVYYWAVTPVINGVEFTGARTINKFRIEVEK